MAKFRNALAGVVLLAAFLQPAAAQETPFDTFAKNVEMRDEGMKNMNLDFYDTVELTGPKEATLTVTEQWMQYVTPADNQGNINSLFDAWRFSHGPAETGVTLIVRDPDGNEIRTVSN